MFCDTNHQRPLGVLRASVECGTSAVPAVAGTASVVPVVLGGASVVRDGSGCLSRHYQDGRNILAVELNFERVMTSTFALRVALTVSDAIGFAREVFALHLVDGAFSAVAAEDGGYLVRRAPKV